MKSNLILHLSVFTLFNSSCTDSKCEQMVSWNQVEFDSYLASLPDLESFPTADKFIVLFDLNSRRYKKSQRMYIEPDDSIIRHILVMKPGGLKDLSWLNIVNESDESQYYSTWDSMLLLCKSRPYREMGLPLIYEDDVEKIFTARYVPDNRKPSELWFKVTCYILKNKVVLCKLTKIPFALLEPSMYKSMKK